MSDYFLLTPQQLDRIFPYLPLARGFRRADDRVVISGIIYVLKGGLRWRDAPSFYGPHKTLYNRFNRWSRMGIFERIFAALAAEEAEPETIAMDSTHIKAHRTAASLRQKKGIGISGAPRAD
jgi:putative transposase